MTDKSDNKKKDSKTSYMTIGAWVIVAIGGGCFAGTIFTPFFANNLETLSQVGDFSSGIVGPLWSLAAVLFFVVALRVQTKQLEAQQIEIQQNRKEMETTREIIEQQKFETTFFNLLENHRNIINNLKITIRDDEWKGRDIINRFYAHFGDAVTDLYPHKNKENIFIFKNNYIEEKNQLTPDEIFDKYYPDKEWFKSILLKFYYYDAMYIEIYLKSIMSIMTIIDNCNNPETKKEYIKIFKRSLSQKDLLLIFYYSLVTPELNTISKNLTILNGLKKSILLHPSHTEFDTNIIFSSDDILNL